MRSHSQLASSKIRGLIRGFCLLIGLSVGCRQYPTPLAQANPKPLNTSSLSPIKTFKGHSDAILFLAFSSDGKSLVTASRDHTVKLWSVSTSQVTQTMRHNLIVWSVAISPDGKTVASGSSDNSIRLWDTKTGRLLRILSLSGSVSSVTFSPNGKYMVSASSVISGRFAVGGQVNIWNLATGKSVWTLRSSGFPQSVMFSPDGKLLLVGDLDKTVKLWNIKTGQLLRTLIGHHGNGLDSQITRVAFSPRGTIVAGGGRHGNGAVWLWDARTGALLHTLRLTGEGSSVCGLAFSPDGKVLASATLTNIQLWDAHTGKSLKSWKDELNTYSLAFTPDGKYLATGTMEDSSYLNKDRIEVSDIHGVVKLWPLK